MLKENIVRQLKKHTEDQIKEFEALGKELKENESTSQAQLDALNNSLIVERTKLMTIKYILND